MQLLCQKKWLCTTKPTTVTAEVGLVLLTLVDLFSFSGPVVQLLQRQELRKSVAGSPYRQNAGYVCFHILLLFACRRYTWRAAPEMKFVVFWGVIHGDGL